MSCGSLVHAMSKNSGVNNDFSFMGGEAFHDGWSKGAAGTLFFILILFFV